MIVVVILLAAIVFLGVVVGVFSSLRSRRGEDKVVVSTGGCATCDGTNDKCEQECMMEASTKPIVYYDDEELDVYKGRRSDDYTDEEVEVFREILYTMRQSEVVGWSRSLTLRGINVPNQIKDELLLLIAG